MKISAHFWTVWPLASELWPGNHRPLPSAVAWRHEIVDPQVGRVALTGELRAGPGTRGLVVLVHGLGGSSNSRYLARAILAAEELGLASLCLSLRGCDRSGDDVYHAGLSSDLASMLADPRLQPFDDLYMLGYSLGGHATLKLATEKHDRRLRAVAAVCAPLDLERTVTAFDRPSRWPYRRYVLSGLKEIYDQVAARREMAFSAAEVRRVNKLREYDRLVVVPRFGFEDTADYYRRASVGSRLGKLGVPALLVAAEGDPMVDMDGIRPALGGKRDHLEVRWFRRGGHVTFPEDFDLGQGERLGLEPQVLRWLVGRRFPLDPPRG